MDERTLRVLEYDKIIEILTAHAQSCAGKELVQGLKPSSDRNLISRWLKETSEAESIIAGEGANPMEVFPDIRDTLKRCSTGSLLDSKELLAIAQTLKIAWNVKKRIEKQLEKKRLEIVSSLVVQLKPLKALYEEIFRCIESEDVISDCASPQLMKIRRYIQKIHEKTRKHLNDIIRSPRFQKYLQDPIITTRNGRYVVPVKKEYRTEVPGLVHDQSASGATLFVEPMSVVEANNELREWLLKEEQEIQRILGVLTSRVREKLQDIKHTFDTLARLDFIFTKGDFSLSIKGICPKLAEERKIKIVNGRHPLIKPEEVVPISLHLGYDFNTLIITGPNTGGKTVTLKTVGLFVLMVQSGLHIPAEPGTEMGIFDGVFADIGDEQSIEQNLSTFSSHMTNIVKIIDKANENSLVLFDELGAGTDPAEGTALAMAILEFLHKKGVLTIATTHYGELKVFAFTREGMENASMEFDVQTLKPTFRLLLGIPGRSNAFEISRRLGLKEELISRAREFLSQEDIRFEDAIRTVERNRIVAERARQEAEELRRQAERLKDEAEMKKVKIENSRNRIIQKAREEARRVLREAKEQADSIIRQLRRLEEEENEKKKNRAIEEIRKRLKNELNKIEESSLSPLEKPFVGSSKPPENLKLGETVHVVSLGQNGQVLSLPDQNGELLVQVGIMKINVHISNVRRVEDEGSHQVFFTSSKVSLNTKTISPELDIRGLTVEEALIKVDKYLDDAFLCGLKEVILIHGRGTGALRSGIHRHLRDHPHVRSFRLGRYGEGEGGVTVVTLR